MHLENRKKKLKYNLNALFQKTLKHFFYSEIISFRISPAYAL